MARITKKQLDHAYESGRKAALNGAKGAPTPYEDAERGLTWMAGYDSAHPKDCAPMEDQDDFLCKKA